MLRKEDYPESEEHVETTSTTATTFFHVNEQGSESANMASTTIGNRGWRQPTIVSASQNQTVWRAFNERWHVTFWAYKEQKKGAVREPAQKGKRYTTLFQASRSDYWTWHWTQKPVSKFGVPEESACLF